jgi:hypothetical protein
VWAARAAWPACAAWDHPQHKATRSQGHKGRRTEGQKERRRKEEKRGRKRGDTKKALRSKARWAKGELKIILTAADAELEELLALPGELERFFPMLMR